MACFIRKHKQMVAAKQDEEEMEKKDRSYSLDFQYSLRST